MEILEVIPSEVYYNIFSFIRSKDWKNVSLTCKLFYYMSYKNFKDRLNKGKTYTRIILYGKDKRLPEIKDRKGLIDINFLLRTKLTPYCVLIYEEEEQENHIEFGVRLLVRVMRKFVYRTAYNLYCEVYTKITVDNDDDDIEKLPIYYPKSKYNFEMYKTDLEEDRQILLDMSKKFKSKKLTKKVKLYMSEKLNSECFTRTSLYIGNLIELNEYKLCNPRCIDDWGYSSDDNDLYFDDSDEEEFYYYNRFIFSKSDKDE